MDYLEMMKQRNPERIALIEDGIEYTYGELVNMAVTCCKDDTIFAHYPGEERERRLHIIRRDRILEQLVEFFACSGRGRIPLLVPMDTKILPQKTHIPERVCMAVATSGTTGEPKILYRTYESWADFFPIQNKIFEIHEDTRLFVQGSLAFTGNLNLFMAQFFAGATVVAQNAFHPKEWQRVIEQKKVNAVYLIPSKLLCLPQVMREANLLVRTVLSGSQSLGGEETLQLKKYFPNAKVILYYGASELSYVTYITDQQMDEHRNLIGKPFPGVEVSVCNGEIYVDTPYHAEGIHCPCTLSDRGYLDKDGNLYFAGRSDDIIEIHGRKVSTYHVENEINCIPGVQESAVLLLQEKNHLFLIAFVRMQDTFLQNKGMKVGCGENVVFQQYQGKGRFLGELKGQRLFTELRKRLAHFEIPCRFIVVQEMPRSESGKIDKESLKGTWKKLHKKTV